MSPSRLRIIPFSLCCPFAVLLALGLLIGSFPALAEAPPNEHRTWRLVSELSEEELARIDFSTDTPRDATIPYLPAEAYPFEAPYTAEEMGFRSMEFPHMPRWNCVQIEDGGVLTPSGYLSNLKVIVLVHYREPAGPARPSDRPARRAVLPLASPRT